MTEAAQPDREARLEQALAEYLQAVEAGQAPDREAFIARHADLADELHSFFADRDHFRHVAGAPVAPEGALPGTAPTCPAGGPPAADPGLGTVRYFGDYELLGEIARGGFGVVFRARQVSLHRPVAVKMVLAGQLASDEDVRRFRAEAETAAALEHPHIVPIYEVGAHQGQHYFSMRLVEGGDLGRHMARIGHDYGKIARLLARVARAVHHAHQSGVLHRDLKPGNVLLEWPDGAGEPVPHVTDFGLAKALGQPSGQTVSGPAVGTPAYMAPEQAAGRNRQLTTAADVWALGTILYELLAGRVPFPAEAPVDVLLKVVSEEPAPPGRVRAGVPRDLEVVCLKCLQKEPGKRYGSALELAEDLERWLNHEPIRARPAGWWERLRKWARRRPAAAALLAVSLAASVLLIAGLTVGLILINDALGRERKAGEERAQALQEVRRLAYVGQINLARQLWETDDPERVEQQLEECDPSLRGWEWGYLKRLCRPELFRLEGSGMAFSPDGEFLACWKADSSEATIHDAWTGKELIRLRGHRGNLTSLVYSPDGKRLATGSQDRTARLWEVVTGKELVVLKGHRSTVTCLDFHPDGRRLATGSGDPNNDQDSGEIKVWDSALGKLDSTLEEKTKSVVTVLFSPDGQRLLSHARRQHFRNSLEKVRIVPADYVPFADEAKLWAVATGTAVTLLSPSKGLVGRCPFAFSPDSKRVALSYFGFQGDVEIRSVAAPTMPLVVMDGKCRSNDGAKFSPDGRCVAFGSTLADASLGKTVLDLSNSGSSSDLGLTAFTPDGLKAVTAGAYGYSVSWIPTGKVIVSGRLSPWNMGLGYVGPDQIKVSADSSRAALIYPGLRRILMLNLADPPASSRLGMAHDSDHHSRATPDGKCFIARSGKSLELHDAFTGAFLRRIGVHDVRPDWCFSPDSTRVAVWDVAQRDDQQGVQGKLIIQDLVGRDLPIAVENISRRVISARFSADGRRLAALHSDPVQLTVWDTVTGKALGTIPIKSRKDSADPPRFSISCDGQLLALTTHWPLDQPHETVVWNVEKGVMVFSLPVGGTALAFTPDNLRLIIASGYDNRARLKAVTLATGEELAFRGHIRSVDSMAVSPDGARLATRGSKAIQLWDTVTGRELLTLPDTETGNEIIFSPDNRSLVAQVYSPQIWHSEAPTEASSAIHATLLKKRRPIWHLGEALRALSYPPQRTTGATVSLDLWRAVRYHLDRTAPFQASFRAETWARYANLASEAGDAAEYQQACEALLRTVEIGSGNPEHINASAWTCCILPNAVKDTKRVVELANKAIALQPKSHAYVNTLGAALYRNGQFADAVKALEQAIALRGEGVPEDWLFLAMAQHRLGNAAEARRWLEKSAAALAKEEKEHSWDAVVRRLLHQEATEQILKKP